MLTIMSHCRMATYPTTRYTSHSATATPTGSPKKRQLPQIPGQRLRTSSRDAADAEDRRRWGPRTANWADGRQYSSAELPRHRVELPDSDLESVVSVTSSAFSTQSERPRGSNLTRYKHQASLFTRILSGTLKSFCLYST